jgi:O-antigen/teichoic acid export membrane protein
MKNGVSQIKAGAALSYLQMFLRIVIGLVYTPVMLRLLGQADYGLYNTVSSTISTLHLLSFGFESAYIKYYAEYKNNDEKEKIYKLNGLFLLIFCGIGIIALLCGVFLCFHLELIFDSGLTTEEYARARILMLLMSVNLAITFPMSVFSNIIGAHERYIFQRIVSSIQTVVSPCLTIPLLLLGYGSVGLTVTSLFLQIVVFLINSYYCKYKLRVRFILRGQEKKLFKNLLTFSAFLALEMIVDQINQNIDKLILGRYQGTISVAIYSVGFSLYAYYQNFSLAISGVFTPRIHRIVNECKNDQEKQRNRLTDLFIRVGRLQFMFLALIATGIIFFGQDFIYYIWAGPGYEDSYMVALLLIIPGTVPLIQNLGIEIQRALGKYQFRCVFYAVMAMINLSISVVLCQKYGAIGCATGTAIAYIFAAGITMNIYYQKRCNLNIILFWKEILKLCRGIVIPVLLGYILMKYIDYRNIYVFFFEIVFYVCIYLLSVFAFGANEYEKDLFRKPLVSFCRKLFSKS